MVPKSLNPFWFAFQTSCLGICLVLYISRTVTRKWRMVHIPFRQSCYEEEVSGWKRKSQCWITYWRNPNLDGSLGIPDLQEWVVSIYISVSSSKHESELKITLFRSIWPSICIPHWDIWPSVSATYRTHPSLMCLGKWIQIVDWGINTLMLRRGASWHVH